MTTCLYPVREEDDDRAHPPEEWGEEWRTSETCDHDWCIEVSGWQREWAAGRQHRESVAIARQDLDMPFAPERDVMEASLWRLK